MSAKQVRALMLALRFNADAMLYTPLSHRGRRAARQNHDQHAWAESRSFRERVMSHPPTDWRLPRDKINELQQEDIAKLVTMCGQAHFVNVRVRINGLWREYEADWLKHLTREQP